MVLESFFINKASVQGKLVENAELAPYTWFGVGGQASLLFIPNSLIDLQNFLKNCEIPVFVLGAGSNVLIREGGIDAAVIRLGKAFNYIRREDNLVICGASCLDANVAQWAASEGLSGLEFLSTIPGTIGGALKMNAGCYGSEIKDVLKWVKVLDLKGNEKTYTVNELKYSYRHCGLEESSVFIEAAFECVSESPEIIFSTINEMKMKRNESQPLKSKTGGSTFRNPDGYKAWELIDSVGGRGLLFHGAQFSEKHCNFLINTGPASASSLEALGEVVRRRVFRKHGIDLHWEIDRIGRK